MKNPKELSLVEVVVSLLDPSRSNRTRSFNNRSQMSIQIRTTWFSFFHMSYSPFGLLGGNPVDRHEWEHFVVYNGGAWDCFASLLVGTQYSSSHKTHTNKKANTQVVKTCINHEGNELQHSYCRPRELGETETHQELWRGSRCRSVQTVSDRPCSKLPSNKKWPCSHFLLAVSSIFTLKYKCFLAYRA